MARPISAAELHEEAMGTKSTETRTLYCVAGEEWNARTQEWELVLRYNHADCESQSRVTYLQARASEGAIVKIVACAPAIGFKVLDNQGLILAA